MRPYSVRSAALAAALLFVPPAVGAQSTREQQAERQEELRQAREEQREELAEQRREREREREEQRAERERDRAEARRDRCDDGDCDEDHGPRPGGRERIDTTVALARRGEVNLSLTAGRIAVRGWDRAEARVQATAEGGTLGFASSASRLTVREEGGHRGSGDARFELTVPYGTRLVMRSVSGDLSAIEVRGEVEARTTSGNVRVDGAAGRTLVESVSGDIDARRLSGPVRGQSVSGQVRLSGVAGDVEVETVSGEIALNQARASFVRLETTSGDVDFTGPLDRAGRYEFTSHSGTITLGLPSDAGAQVSVETFSGELDTAFPLTLTPNARDGRPRRFEFTLGGGGARLTAESFSGDVNLRRTGATTPRE